MTIKNVFFFKTNVVILQLKKVVGYDIKNVFLLGNFFLYFCVLGFCWLGSLLFRL